MALVRRGTCQFFVRSFRRNGRVTSRYLGSGTIALDAARSAGEARTRKAAERRARSEELARWGNFDAAFTCLCELNRAHAQAAMFAAGYYLHRRQWRPKGNRMTTPAKVTPADVPATVRARVADFLGRSGQAEVTADDCVRFFDSVKDELTPAAYRWVIKRLVRQTGHFDVLPSADPRARAQQALVKWLNAPGLGEGPHKPVSPADHELSRRYLDVQRDELAGPDAPPLERMLADQVVLAWTEVNGLTARTVDHERRWDFESVAHYDKRQARATRRLHDSIKLLHLIRQKAGPALQVTVNQSVSVPAPVDPTPGGPEPVPSRIGRRPPALATRQSFDDQPAPFA